MTIKEVTITVKLLEELKVRGGKRYQKVDRLLREEATTHNLEKLEQLLVELNAQYHIRAQNN